MRFLALDGLRGCCALMVVLFHCSYLSHIYALPLVRNGYLFVDFFFVLSGFVISTAYSERLGNTISLPDFVLRRIGRLWPLHVFILMAFVALEGLKAAMGHWITTENIPFTGSNSPSSIISNLFLIQALGLYDQLGWNTPSWSISVEFYTYLVFAAVTLTTKRFRLLWYGALSFAGFAVLARFSPHYMNATYDYAFFRCLYGFFLGCAIFWAYTQSWAYWLSRLRYMRVLEIAAFSACLTYLIYAAYGQASFAMPLLFALVIYCFAFETGPISKLMLSRPAQWLGTWSYSIYMVHFFLLIALQMGVKLIAKPLGLSITASNSIDASGETVKTYDFGGIWVMDGMTLLYVAMVICVAAITYRMVEVPGRNLFNRIAARYN